MQERDPGRAGKGTLASSWVCFSRGDLLASSPEASSSSALRLLGQEGREEDTFTVKCHCDVRDAGRRGKYRKVNAGL